MPRRVALLLVSPLVITAKRIALQISGHLRSTCSSKDNMDVLTDSVVACRSTGSECDVFLHTWDQLNASTSSWHTPRPAPASPSAACAQHVAAVLGVSRYQLEAERYHGNETWWTRRRGNSHISLAGIRSSVYTQSAANALRRAHERHTGRTYDAVVRLRPDLYSGRDNPDKRMWDLIASAANVSNAIFSCREYRWPGMKGGDQCFFALAPTAFDRLYDAWESTAEHVLPAMACAWQRRSKVCKRQRLTCNVDVRMCGPGVDPGQGFAENMMASAQVRAGLDGRDRSVLASKVDPPNGVALRACVRRGPRGSAAAPCASAKTTPCPMTDLTEEQCRAQCDSKLRQGCGAVTFEPQTRRCYLIQRTHFTARAACRHATSARR